MRSRLKKALGSHTESVNDVDDADMMCSARSVHLRADVSASSRPSNQGHDVWRGMERSSRVSSWGEWKVGNVHIGERDRKVME